MKTEKEIIESMVSVSKNLSHTVVTLRSEIERGNWTDAQETCFTLLVNLAALEAAERILL